MRRILTTSAIVLGLVCTAPALAPAQGWQPTRPIKMICPFPNKRRFPESWMSVALKLPEPSRATIVFGTLALVAVVALPTALPSATSDRRIPVHSPPGAGRPMGARPLPLLI